MTFLASIRKLRRSMALGKASANRWANEPVHLDTTADDHPQLDTEQQRLLDGATVQILGADDTDGKQPTTGFLTRDGDGRLVAVTAGHVVNKYGNRVRDSTGRQSAVVADRLIYESSRGSNADLGRPYLPGEIDRDVAVLVPAAPIGSATLELSLAPPTRGTWYTTTNYSSPTFGSSASPVDKPSRYDLLGLGRSIDPDETVFWLLSGVQPHRPGIDATWPGGSGAPVVTIPTDGSPPQVVGIITGGNQHRPAPPRLMRLYYALSVTGPATPKLDYIVTADVLGEAVSAAGRDR
jgi:hypothetical protein